MKPVKSLHQAAATEIISYYDKTRGVGHTETVQNGVYDDALVIAHTLAYGKKAYGRHTRKIVTPRTIAAGTLRGRKDPLVMDNEAVRVLLSELLQDIEKANDATAAEALRADLAERRLFNIHEIIHSGQ